MEYILENDLEKREITILLTEGKSAITLSETWVYMLMDQLKDQTREWKQLQ